MESIGKYHISPYVRIQATPNATIFHQTLFNRTIQIKMTPSQRKMLLDALSDGCTEEQMSEQLSSIYGSEHLDLLKELLREGVIE